MVSKIIKICKFTGNEKILDFGCGVGEIADMFSQQNLNVIGIDLSDTAIGIAQKKYQKTKFEIGKLTNSNKLIISEKEVDYSSFDMIFAKSVTFMKNPNRCKPLLKYIKSGGYLVICNGDMNCKKTDYSLLGKVILKEIDNSYVCKLTGYRSDPKCVRSVSDRKHIRGIFICIIKKVQP